MSGDGAKDKKTTETKLAKKSEEIEMEPEWGRREPPAEARGQSGISKMAHGAGAGRQDVAEGAQGLIDSKSAEPSAVDFTEFDEAYENVATYHRGIVNRQQIAVREVLGNLNEADSPSISDEILRVLAVTALGYASGALSQSVGEKLSNATAQVLENSVQTALDDGFKEAVTAGFEKVNAREGATSKATFFASQEEALETTRDAGEIS